MKGELNQGTVKRNKEAWREAVISEFPKLSGEAWKRIWRDVTELEEYRYLRKPGRRPD